MKISAGDSIGRYHILEQLGEGGMAAVYKAYDTRLERDVAIKFLRTELFGSAVLDQLFRRFEREAKALAHLSHLHIVKIYDYGEYENTPYLVMEYVPGGTLKSRMGKPMDFHEAFSLILPIAEALDYAHKERVLHRDVKPSNVLITQRGEPLLSDFGIAKILESDESMAITSTGVGIGTPEYMAPEQGLAQAVDARTDVYALGVVLYEMLTGHKPYTADTPTAVLLKQIHDPLPNPTEYVSDIPENVIRVLLKALAKQPENRYESMAEFARAMQQLLKPSQAETTDESTLVVDWRPKLEEPPATLIREVAADKASVEPPGPAGEILPERRLREAPFKSMIAGLLRFFAGRRKWILIALGCAALAGIIWGVLAVFQPFGPMAALQIGVNNGYILFTSDRTGNDEIYRMTETGEVDRLTNTPGGGSSNSPTPNPQGYLFYVSNQSGSREIYRLERDGTSARITNSGPNGESINPVFDPNSYLLFCSNREGKYEIYRMDLQGNTSKVTDTPGAFQSCSPAVDAYGNLLFASNREDGKWEIYRMSSAGNIDRLTHTEGRFQSDSPVADPASYMVFVSNRDGKREIYRMDKSGNISQVTHTEGTWESWSPSVNNQGDFLFTSNRGGFTEVYRISSEGVSAQVTNSDKQTANWGAIFEP